MVKEKWTRYGDKIEYDEIAREYNISNIMAKIIRNRGVERNDIGKYLSSDLSQMYSPWLMKDMKKAVDIIKLKNAVIYVACTVSQRTPHHIGKDKKLGFARFYGNILGVGEHFVEFYFACKLKKLS